MLLVGPVPPNTGTVELWPASPQPEQCAALLTVRDGLDVRQSVGGRQLLSAELMAAGPTAIATAATGAAAATCLDEHLGELSSLAETQLSGSNNAQLVAIPHDSRLTDCIGSVLASLAGRATSGNTITVTLAEGMGKVIDIPMMRTGGGGTLEIRAGGNQLRPSGNSILVDGGSTLMIRDAVVVGGHFDWAALLVKSGTLGLFNCSVVGSQQLIVQRSAQRSAQLSRDGQCQL